MFYYTLDYIGIMLTFKALITAPAGDILLLLFFLFVCLFFYIVFFREYDLAFHVNRLLADDQHEILSSVLSWKYPKNDDDDGYKGRLLQLWLAL